MTEYSPLQSEIKKLIKSSGPMPVWRYMELCLTHPKHGYYVSRDPLGREGDFTTAPEVSQMFGELLGLWAASVWKAIGSPSAAAADRTRTRPRHHDGGCAARAAGAAAALSVAQHPSRRDQSGAARKAEGDAVGRAQRRLARQYRRRARRSRGDFRQRIFRRAADPPGGEAARPAGTSAPSRSTATANSVFGAAPEPMPRFEVLLPPLVRAAPVGAVFEWRPDAEIMKIASRVRDQDGAALIIDYGHLRSDAGDTFQAIARHSFTDPLKNPGQADVTAHVDFQALVARRRGSRRARPRPGDAGRVPEAARHRNPRGHPDGEEQPRFPRTFPAR